MENTKNITAVILAAGYGTRLTRDIQADESGIYSHFQGVPKPLIPVGGKPLINYWVELLSTVPSVTRTLVVCNNFFGGQFEHWAEMNQFPKENLVMDGTSSNETRLGAIADIALVLESAQIEDNLMVIAGDTLFMKDFSLGPVIKHFEDLPTGSNLILFYELSDHAEVQKRGILETNDQDMVVNFLEKPLPSETTSNKACPPLYIYSKATVPLFKQYVAQFKDERDKLDAPGGFISWLHSRAPVYAREIAGRFDIGGLADYIIANSYFS